MEIGDKVKFNSYIPINMINHTILKKTLLGEKAFIGRKDHLKRTPTTVEYKTVLWEEEKPMDGIYVGHFFKKLNRKYRLSTPEQLKALEMERILSRRSVLRCVRPVHSRERYSINPRRLDDPRSLDKIAMVNIGKKIIGVPMVNIIKNDPSHIFRVI